MLWILFAAALILSVDGAEQGTRLLDPSRMNHDGSPEGWALMVKAGTPRLRPIIDGGRSGVCLEAENSSFSINRPVDIDLKKTPTMRWSWRAEILPARGDFRNPSRDDQAAQLFVIFARRGISTRTAINYIWDTNAPEGATGDYYIPLLINVKTVVVVSGSLSVRRWITLQRSIADDYKRLFADDPPHVAAVRFQTNAQHTRSRAEGCISEILFE